MARPKKAKINNKKSEITRVVSVFFILIIILGIIILGSLLFICG
jgi:hypothetical protein